MRVWVTGIGALLLLGGSASAQETQPAPTSDAKAQEVKTFIERARIRQRTIDRRNTDLWQRWTYAVCIGCGGSAPGPHRMVYTTPGRVLAGIPAADDDARARSPHHRMPRRDEAASAARRAPLGQDDTG